MNHSKNIHKHACTMCICIFIVLNVHISVYTIIVFHLLYQCTARSV